MGEECPGIVPFPINVEDQSIFAEMFQSEWCTIIEGQNNDEHMGTTDFTEQHITQDENIADTPEQMALDAILIEQNQRFQVDPAQRIIQLHDHFVEPNLWLNRTGFDRHLHL